jgi:hypothetical protein
VDLGSRLEEIRAEILAELGTVVPVGMILGHGFGNGTVRLKLAATGEREAKHLVERYGDTVEVTVGLLRYPMDRAEAVVLPRDATSSETVTIEGLAANLELEPTVLAAGSNGGGRVLLRSSAKETIAFGTASSILAWVVDPVTDSPIGGYEGAITLPAASVHLDPGESAEIPVHVGTASCVPELGYVLPPGNHLVRADVPVRDGSRAAAHFLEPVYAHLHVRNRP